MTHIARTLVLLLWVAVASFVRFPAAAQDDLGFEVYDEVVLIVPRMPVHTQADEDSTVATDILGGMVSRVLAIEPDNAGLMWVYLANNAFGWILLPPDGTPVLAINEDGVHDALIAEATAAIAADETDAEAYILRGGAYLGQQEFGAALADFTHLIDLSPESGVFYEYRGKVYLDMKAYELAEADFEQAIELGSAQVGTYNRLGITYIERQSPAEARTAYGGGLQIDDTYGLLFNNIGSSYYADANYSQAIDHYIEAIARDPYLAQSLYNRALAHQALGAYDTALSFYTEALAIDPACANCYVNRGYIYRTDLGQIDLAIEDYKQAIEIDPTNSYTHYNLGFLYSEEGRYESAIDSYTQAGILNPGHALAGYLYRPQLYLALGDYERAEADIVVYIANITGQGASQALFVTTSYLLFGEILLLKQDYATASAMYTSAFEMAPEFVRNYAYYGAGYRVTPLRELLIPDLVERIQASPQDTSLLLEAGVLYMEFGRWQEALDTYNAYLAVESNPDIEHLVETIEQIIG